MCFDFKEVFRHEVFNLFIAAHHQPEHGCLHAPHGKHALITSIATENGVSTGHIDAVQPVGTRSRQRRNAQRYKLTVGTKTVDRPLNRLRVQVVYQATLHLLALFRCQLQIVQHFIHQQLPFTIRVPGVNDFAGFMQEPFDDVKLFGHGGSGL